MQGKWVSGCGGEQASLHGADLLQIRVENFAQLTDLWGQGLGGS